ncbi:hypothetical protein NKJ04_17740 [Mesorhizobium sp. M0618]|uniref:hypothetical protein n=1 Tax=Mesorhizobium sp. M0618 TaxID=2956972 RepID=UPI0033399641
MTMFSRIEGGHVLLTNRGVYQEADLYRRGEELFASLKTGFGRLLADDLTTVPGIRWKAIEGFPFVKTPFGPREIIPEPAEQSQSRRRKLRAI